MTHDYIVFNIDYNDYECYWRCNKKKKIIYKKRIKNKKKNIFKTKIYKKSLPSEGI